MTNPEEIHYVTEEQVEAALEIIREYDEANRSSDGHQYYPPISLDTILDEMNDPMLERTAAVSRVTSLVYELWQDDRVTMWTRTASSSPGSRIGDGDDRDEALAPHQ